MAEKSIQKETQEKISKLQMIEENLQQYAVSKQTINSSILEIDSALLELEGKNKAYKICGFIMIEKPSSEIKKDLEDKKKTNELRLKSIEKQEERIKQNFDVLQKEVLNELKRSE
jgi:prefoldin beta subunit